MHSNDPSPYATPLEQADFQRLSSAEEIAAYMRRMTQSSPHAQIETWGHSVQGKALLALRIASNDSHGERLRILIVGSQHGASEAAGGEALMVVTRQLLHEDLHPLLRDCEFYLLPAANPDGLNADSSKNANKVNLNRDYVLLSQPESYAIDQALFRIRPHVVLDAHESAALKRNTLAKEGYMTEFQAQFDFANNPAIRQHTQHFCEHHLLEPLLSRIAQQGLQTQRYIREIRSLTQPLTHGGVAAHIFRNKAGVCGALSFLLETRMETKYGHYDSFRNIRVRHQRQVLCIREFLRLVQEKKAPILNEYKLAQQWMATCLLSADYVPHPEEPLSRLPLRRVDTEELVDIEFRNHRHNHFHSRIKRPRAYIITDHIADISALLTRNALHFDYLTQTGDIETQALAVWQHQEGSEEMQINIRPQRLRLLPGFLYVPLAQARGNLLPQLLEPQSKSSIFQHEAFRAWRHKAGKAFVYRCPASQIVRDSPV